MNNTVRVWVDDYGDTVMPQELIDCTRYRKDGWPDMRYSASQRALQWAQEQRQSMKASILQPTKG